MKWANVSNAQTAMTWTIRANVSKRAKISVINTDTSIGTATLSMKVVAHALKYVKSAQLDTIWTGDSSARKFQRIVLKSTPIMEDASSASLGLFSKERLAERHDQSSFAQFDALSIYTLKLFKEINYIKINQITTFVWCLFRLFYERNALNIILFFENAYHFFCGMPDERDRCSKKIPPCLRKALEKLAEWTKINCSILSCCRHESLARPCLRWLFLYFYYENFDWGEQLRSMNLWCFYPEAFFGDLSIDSLDCKSLPGWRWFMK